MDQTLKIGSQIWRFDVNRRVYTKENGHGPVWREHWRPMWIIGETRVSWIVGHTADSAMHSGGLVKLPKRTDWPQGWATSQAHIDEAAWAHENRYAISQLIFRLDPEDLKAVADLIAYKSS